MTDGRFDKDLTPASEEAGLARSQGITVIAIGVNVRVPKDNFEMLTNDPYFVFMMDSKNDYDKIIYRLSRIVCPAWNGFVSTRKPTDSPNDNDIFKTTRKDGKFSPVQSTPPVRTVPEQVNPNFTNPLHSTQSELDRMKVSSTTVKWVDGQTTKSTGSDRQPNKTEGNGHDFGGSISSTSTSKWQDGGDFSSSSPTPRISDPDSGRQPNKTNEIGGPGVSSTTPSKWLDEYGSSTLSPKITGQDSGRQPNQTGDIWGPGVSSTTPSLWLDWFSSSTLRSKITDPNSGRQPDKTSENGTTTKWLDAESYSSSTGTPKSTDPDFGTQLDRTGQNGDGFGGPGVSKTTTLKQQGGGQHRSSTPTPKITYPDSVGQSDRIGQNGDGFGGPGVSKTTPSNWLDEGSHSSSTQTPMLTDPHSGKHPNSSGGNGDKFGGETKSTTSSTFPNHTKPTDSPLQPGISGSSSQSGFSDNKTTVSDFDGKSTVSPKVLGPSSNLPFVSDDHEKPSVLVSSTSETPGGVTKPTENMNDIISDKPFSFPYSFPEPLITKTTWPQWPVSSADEKTKTTVAHDATSLHGSTISNGWPTKPRVAHSTTLPPTIPWEEGINCRLDLLFVLDGSGSVTKENFRKQLEAAKAALRSFHLAPSGVNVALITFSSHAQLHFSFTDTRYESLNEIERRIDSVNWFNQRTNHGAALKLATERVFNETGGDRQYADNVMVLVTDSATNTDDIRKQDIQALKDAGVRIFVITVAAKDATEARSIASEPIFYHLTQVLDYFEMYKVFQILEKLVCAVNIPEPVYSLNAGEAIYVAILTTLNGDDPGFRSYFADQLRKYSDELAGVTFFAYLNGVSPRKVNNNALSMAKFLDRITRLPVAPRDLEAELRDALILLDFENDSSKTNIVFALTDAKENDEPGQIQRLKKLIDDALEKGILVFVVVKGSILPTVLLHHRFTKYFREYERSPEIVPILFETDLAPIIYSCTFEDDMNPSMLMTQAKDDQFDWTIHSGGTRSRHTGPQQAYKGVRYAYIEASAPQLPGDMATLIFHSLRDHYGSFICVQFSYHMRGYHTGTLFLYTTADSGRNRKIFWMLSGHQGKDWFSTQVTVFFNAEMRISAIRGTEFSSDIGIDEIVVRKGPCALDP